MIPRLSSRSTRTDGRGQSFRDLSSYLFNGDRSQPNPERADWSEAINCHASDPSNAWHEMAWTYQHAAELKAAAGVRRGGQKNEFPVWHVSLNWGRNERPERADMMKAVQGMLDRFGLSEHQALVVHHNDTMHDHVHVMVNLVNPHSGRTVDVSKSTKLRLSAWAREYGQEHDRTHLTPQREANWKQREGNKAMRAVWLDMSAQMPSLGKPKLKGTYDRSDSRPLWELKRRARDLGMPKDGLDQLGDRHRETWNGHFAGKRAEAEAAPPRRLDDPAVILERIMRAQSTFTREDLARAVNAVTRDASQFDAVFHKVLAIPEVKALEVHGSKPRYSTESVIRTEQEMAEAADKLAAGQKHGVGTPRTADTGTEKDRAALEAMRERFGIQAGRGRVAAQLGTEQRAALDHITDAKGLACVVGYAGTGKSTMLGAARERWEDAGYTIRGAAISGIASQGLEAGSGIKSTTLHALQGQLARGTLKLGRRDIIVVDEAGMVSSRQMHAVVTAAQQAGAKVVLVGDPSQLQAIDAGGAFRAIVERTGAATITEVRRQRSEWQQQATRDLAEGRVEEAIAAYVGNSGAVRGHATKGDAIKALIGEWSRDLGQQTPGFIMAATRKDVAALNEQAREAMRAAGQLKGKDFKIQAREEREDKHGNIRGHEFVMPMAEGERVLFTKNDNKMAVKNGTLGTFEGVKGNRLLVRLDGPEQRRVEVDITGYRNLAPGYALTIHKSQSVTVEHAHVLASRNMDRHLAYVAMTRHRESVRMHYSRTDMRDIQALAKRLGRDRPKDTTLDYTKPVTRLPWQEREARAERALLHGTLARSFSSAAVSRGSVASQFMMKSKPTRDLGRQR